MLPKNHLVTEYIRPQNNMASEEWLKYLSTLNAAQQEELRRVIYYHQNMVEAVAYEQPTQPAPQVYTSNTPREQNNKHIHIHHHDHYHYHNNYWYDWFIWQSLISSNHSYHSRPPVTTNRRTKEEQNNAAAVILATLIVGCAVIASLYTVIEAGRCFEQLAYAEDVFGNMTRLAMTAFGAALGIGGGLLFGSAVLGMPVLGAICGALIFAGLAIAASKKIVEAVHRKTNDDSALAYDPRFCLSRKEKAQLQEAGYDVFAVGEALRALAIKYDTAHSTASSFKFWSADNKEKAILIDMVRDLKKGWIWDNKHITIGNQRFDLNPAPVTGIPVDVASHNDQPPTYKEVMSY